MNTSIDVRDYLSRVQVPTLIMHRRDDRDVKLEEGRYIAERIEGARFVEFDGEDHLPFSSDIESVLRCTDEFVTSLPAEHPLARAAAPVVSAR